MTKLDKLELLHFCLDYPKPLSIDFICKYCGFPNAETLRSYANHYGISQTVITKKTKKNP